MLAVTKAKSNPIIKSQDMHIQKENTLDETTMNLLKSCYDFKVLKAGERPQVEGNDLSDKEVAKCATAYKILVERNRAAASVGTQMKEAFILKHTTDMQKQEVTKSEEAVIAETAVATEAVATEATAEAATTEETTTAEKSAEEVTTEATATEEATTEVIKTEEVTEETTEVKTDVATEVSGDTLATKSTDETKDEAVTTVSEEVGDEASINKTVTEDAEASPTSEVTETAEVASEATTEKTEAISEKEILEKAKAMFDEAITAAVEKAVSGVTAQFSETISKMQAELDSAKETVTKSHKDEADKFSAIEKSVGELTGIATQQATLIQKMNTAFAGRRSLATTVVEKSFGSDGAESLTQDTIAAEIHKAMDADSKMTFGEARASVYKRLEQSA